MNLIICPLIARLVFTIDFNFYYLKGLAGSSAKRLIFRTDAVKHILLYFVGKIKPMC